MYETVIEVVQHAPDTDTYFVVSGWGTKSDWYLNIQKNPIVTVWVGGRCLPARTANVSVDKAADILQAYSERYPIAFRELTRLFLGARVQPGREAGRMLAERMPMVAFQPTQNDHVNS
jgi:deazaflavin-dependent oxidoreductase (nitroreductase family)